MLRGVSSFLFLLVASTAFADDTCPAGRTSSGCSAAEMDAYGCCPIKASTKPTSTGSSSSHSVPAAPASSAWGQRAAGGQCSMGLVASTSTGGVCCWPGQAFNGVTCLGTPSCPTPYVASGNGCVIGACEMGEQRAPDGVHCCWPGQAFSTEVGDCVGTPKCPSGSTVSGGGCAWPTVTVKGTTRAATSSARLGTLAWIPSGSFRMGPSGLAADGGAHPVDLSRGYWMMKSEVSQAMWEGVMGDNPAWFDDCGDTCPVEQVSWLQAVQFANAVSQADGLAPAYTIAGEQVTWNPTSTGWRLPTEAEWEYAARGGSGTERGGGGWSKANSDETSHAACGQGANGFGLCDMAGNVWEWVWHWYGNYGAAQVKDPTGPATGARRVRRGGAWSEPAAAGLVTTRDARPPSAEDDKIGFRLVRFEK